MKINQKIKLFLYFASIFVIFTFGVIAQQLQREKEFRQETLLGRLDIYTSIAANDPHSGYLPHDIRITIISLDGRVEYESSADSTHRFDSHFSRREIMQAKTAGTGHDIRVSKTTGKKYLYYARRTTDRYIRAALPITQDNASLVESSISSIIFALTLFIVAMIFLWLISRRFGSNMIRLSDDVVRGKAQKERLKTEMTSSIAHELRTPIATIRAYTETLLDNELTDQERQQFTERTHAAAIRLSELIRDVSLLSRLDANQQLFDTQTINIHDLTRQVIEEFAPQIQENSITVDNLLPTDLTLSANETLLHSILANLIENSIKYGGKWITVRIELIDTTNNMLHLRISDTGIGIEAKHLERIFERFYRVDTGRARSDGGSGLGMSIVRHAVLYHGGKIWASNAPSGGLVVDFTLGNF
ncbi:MAG: ATP-binding protein [Mucinivorans sp.]